MWAILLTSAIYSSDGSSSIATNVIGNYSSAQSCESVAKQLRTSEESNWSKYTVLARCVQIKDKP